MSDPDKVLLPSQVDEHVGIFDKFAERAALFTSRAPYFVFCVALIVIWLPTILFLDFDAWNFAINSSTTVITFLVVALIQNSQFRDNNAVQHKLNAVSDGLANLIEYMAEKDDDSRNDLQEKADELRSAVGVERREST
jgi:low affinity Fe/Cu permease